MFYLSDHVQSQSLKIADNYMYMDCQIDDES